MYLCSHSGGHFFLHTPQIRSFICHRCRQSFTNYNPPMPRTSSAKNWYMNHGDPERPKNPWRCILEICSFTVCGECAETVQEKLKRLKKVADLKMRIEKGKEGREAAEGRGKEGGVGEAGEISAHHGPNGSNGSNGDNEGDTGMTEPECAERAERAHNWDNWENSNIEAEIQMIDSDLSEWPDLSLFNLDTELKRDILAPEIRRAIAVPREKKTSGEKSPAGINRRPREGEKRKEMPERREERTRPPPQSSHIHHPSTTSVISTTSMASGTSAQPQQIQHASTEMEVMEVEVDDGSGDEYNIEFLRRTTRSAANAAAEAGMNARARVRRITMLDRRDRETRDTRETRETREPKVRRMEGME
ncbi:Protein of unknown function [Pyronema omphalodes CBS 100304]|uniref:Uncharacterized protein n=1 Tax=Pyronema omphalodes (strain CBS 100304) TaxID=1076935 RepID=U4LCW7_PYROM|nr:Protein of unknown function [Pyronema omphalodes CBS 100304]